MPYPDSATLTNIFAIVRKEFEELPEYRKSDINNNWLIYKANEDLDEIYHDCFPEPHQITFDSAEDTWYYPFDGSTDPPNIAAGLIDEIIRVDYDGEPLVRLLAVGDMILPTSESTSADPEHWFEMFRDGTRYLCFDAPCRTSEEVRLWVTRTPAVLADTSGKPAIDKDFWSLLQDMLICDIYRKLRMYKDCDYWELRRVQPKKARLRRKQDRRLGKYAKRIGILGATDVLSNS